MNGFAENAGTFVFDGASKVRHEAAAVERRVTKVVMIGGSQHVRIPKDMRLDGTEAMISRDGDRLVIEAVRTHGFRTEEDIQAFLASIRMSDFPDVSEHGREDVLNRVVE